MPANTTYNPQNKNDFEKVKLQKDAYGVQANITLGGVTNIDLVMTDDVLLTGAVLLVSPAFQGDKADFQVLGGGNVLAQFITDWYMNPGSVEQRTPESQFPAKVFAGLTLRVVYHAAGPLVPIVGGLVTPVWVAINYDRQKVLI